MTPTDLRLSQSVCKDAVLVSKKKGKYPELKTPAKATMEIKTPQAPVKVNLAGGSAS